MEEQRLKELEEVRQRKIQLLAELEIMQDKKERERREKKIEGGDLSSSEEEEESETESQKAAKLLSPLRVV